MSPEEAVETVLMRSPSVSGVPVSIARSMSRRCARRAPPRGHSSQPPSGASAARYAALLSAAVRRVGARGFPLARAFGATGVAVFAVLGILFHVANAVIMGLNTFVWAFVATYPAILFCAVSLRQ
jgi:hypothetical protein